MLALDDNFDQMCVLQAMQMYTGCGGADARDDGQFCAGAGMAVHKGKEHAGACGLTNSGGNGGNGMVGVQCYIHSLIVNES